MPKTERETEFEKITVSGWLELCAGLFQGRVLSAAEILWQGKSRDRNLWSIMESYC